MPTPPIMRNTNTVIRNNFIILLSQTYENTRIYVGILRLIFLLLAYRYAKGKSKI